MQVINLILFGCASEPERKQSISASSIPPEPIILYTSAANSTTFSLQNFRNLHLWVKCIIGDTNTRLGSLLCDKSIHGNYVTNPNSPLLSEFLEFSGLTVLNRIFCLGVPTYEIVNRKRSYRYVF